MDVRKTWNTNFGNSESKKLRDQPVSPVSAYILCLSLPMNWYEPFLSLISISSQWYCHDQNNQCCPWLTMTDHWLSASLGLPLVFAAVGSPGWVHCSPGTGQATAAPWLWHMHTTVSPGHGEPRDVATSLRVANKNLERHHANEWWIPVHDGVGIHTSCCDVLNGHIMLYSIFPWSWNYERWLSDRILQCPRQWWLEDRTDLRNMSFFVVYSNSSQNWSICVPQEQNTRWPNNFLFAKASCNRTSEYPNRDLCFCLVDSLLPDVIPLFAGYIWSWPTVTIQ